MAPPEAKKNNPLLPSLYTHNNNDNNQTLIPKFWGWPFLYIHGGKKRRKMYRTCRKLQSA